MFSCAVFTSLPQVSYGCTEPDARSPRPRVRLVLGCEARLTFEHHKGSASRYATSPFRTDDWHRRTAIASSRSGQGSGRGRFNGARFGALSIPRNLCSHRRLVRQSCTSSSAPIPYADHQRRSPSCHRRARSRQTSTSAEGFSHGECFHTLPTTRLLEYISAEGGCESPASASRLADVTCDRAPSRRDEEAGSGRAAVAVRARW